MHGIKNYDALQGSMFGNCLPGTELLETLVTLLGWNFALDHLWSFSNCHGAPTEVFELTQHQETLAAQKTAMINAAIAVFLCCNHGNQCGNLCGVYHPCVSLCSFGQKIHIRRISNSITHLCCLFSKSHTFTKQLSICRQTFNKLHTIERGRELCAE